MAGNDDRHRVLAVRGANRAPGGRPPDGPRELRVGHGRPGGHAAKRHPYIALEGSAARLDQDVVHGAEVAREVGVDPTADAERIAGRLESRGAIARGELGEHAATAVAKVEAHEALVPGHDDDAADRRGHLIREEVHGRLSPLRVAARPRHQLATTVRTRRRHRMAARRAKCALVTADACGGLVRQSHAALLAMFPHLQRHGIPRRMSFPARPTLGCYRSLVKSKHCDGRRPLDAGSVRGDGEGLMNSECSDDQRACRDQARGRASATARTQHVLENGGWSIDDA